MYEEFDCDELTVLAKRHKKDGNAKVCSMLHDKGCCAGDDDECC